jgi:Mycothiol maleylpyruvate isomerase N-terminal domain
VAQLDIRNLFVRCSESACELASSEEVAHRWTRESVLPRFSVQGLAGHLFRATGSVEAYLDRDEPDGTAIDAAEYYRQAVGETDIDSDLHRAVRQRGEEAASEGHEALVRRWREMSQRLATRLAAESPDRKLRVFKDLVIGLDDYLITRIVELLVHCDDLALSIDVEPPKHPQPAYDAAIDCLVRVARLRHGDQSILRALTRRERDTVEALRVL